MSELSVTDKKGYLANILAIALADGTASPEELRLVQSIAQRIGAGPADLAEARLRAERGGYRLVMMGDPPARLANFEDMLMVGLADGRIAESESGPMEALAASMKFNQIDIDMALRRAQFRLARLMPKSQSAAATTPPPPPVPPRTPPSRAAKAMQERLRTMTPPRSREPMARRSTPRAAVDHTPAPMLTAPWQKKAGEPASFPAPEPDLSPEAGAGTEAEGPPMPPPVAAEIGTPLSIRDACILARAATDDPDGYCHGLHTGDPNPWGCRLAEMPLAAGADWLTCGRFRDDRTFIFDRAALTEMLAERLTIAAGCPHLDLDRVRRALEALPSRAVSGLRWSHRTAATAEHGTEVSIQRYIHGCPLTERILAECMDPATPEAAQRIVRATRRAARRETERSVVTPARGRRGDP
jgi:hypothetical protein